MKDKGQLCRRRTSRWLEKNRWRKCGRHRWVDEGLLNNEVRENWGELLLIQLIRKYIRNVGEPYRDGFFFSELWDCDCDGTLMLSLWVPGASVSSQDLQQLLRIIRPWGRPGGFSDSSSELQLILSTLCSGCMSTINEDLSAIQAPM